MVGSYPNPPINRLPKNTTQYPIRIGKSLRKNRNNPSNKSLRDIMAIKFNHVPAKVNLNQPGTIQANGERCTIQLPMENGNSIHFNGSRKVQKSHSSVHDYVLIFHRDCFWLERVSDMILGMKPVDIGKQRAPIEYPSQQEDDDPQGDPDSWMCTSNHDPESGTPITPEGDIDDEIPQPIIPPSRVGGKSTPNPPSRKMINSSMKSTINVTNHQPMATKSLASKSLATKGLSRRPVVDDDDDSNRDSSSSDDSDDSGSDSGDDSGDYTEESSDEE